MAQYDLTSVLAQHLDRHLVFPLLEFLGSKGLYDEKDIEAAKLALIEKTNMVDYAVDIYQQLNQTDEVRSLEAQRAGAALCELCKPWCANECPDEYAVQRLTTSQQHPSATPLQVPESLRARRGEVVARLKSLEAAVKPVTDFLSNEDNVKLLKQDKTQNMAFLQKEFGIGAGLRMASGCLPAALPSVRLCGKVQRALHRPPDLIRNTHALRAWTSRASSQALTRWMRCTTLPSGTLSAATTLRRQSTFTTTARFPPTLSAPSRPSGARSLLTCCSRCAGVAVAPLSTSACTAPLLPAILRPQPAPLLPLPRCRSLAPPWTTS